MKLNSISNMSFQKTLVAKTKFKKNTSDKKTKECKIYVLDSSYDVDYIRELKKNKNWKNANFLNMLNYDLRTSVNPFTCIETYVMELGKENECVACAEVHRFNNITEVRLLETAPAYRNEPKTKNKPKVNHIGETFLAFFAKQGQKSEESGRIELTSVPTAVAFYEDKCGFFSGKYCGVEMYLPQIRYKALIKQNKKHTGGKIKLEA